MKRTYNKRENITDTTFDFTQQKVQYQIQYQDNGKAPNKRYDKSIQGLCLFVYPSGIKTFYALRFLQQYNKKKNRTEKNAVYNNINGQIYDVKLSTLLKFFILKTFPENIKLINYYKNEISKKKNKNSNRFFNKYYDNEGNINKKLIDKLVKQFISNHKLMSLISESRGASHIVVLQLGYSLNLNGKSSNLMKHQDYLFKKISL